MRMWLIGLIGCVGGCSIFVDPMPPNGPLPLPFRYRTEARCLGKRCEALCVLIDRRHRVAFIEPENRLSTDEPLLVDWLVIGRTDFAVTVAGGTPHNHAVYRAKALHVEPSDGYAPPCGPTAAD